VKYSTRFGDSALHAARARALSEITLIRAYSLHGCGALPIIAAASSGYRLKGPLIISGG
jgi:hypothetical protein